MPAPANPFKAAIKAGRQQYGLWLAMASGYSAEICASAGYDWLLVDAEHAPNDMQTLVSQLQVIEHSPSHAIVRPPVGETWIIKRLLDIGAQTLLIPMVESREQAEQLVRAMRYPPHGVRGVGASIGRASNFNRVPDYLSNANEEVCLLVQVENRAGLESLDAIATVEGVDGVFIGPSDLAADLGYLGRPGAPDVQEKVEDAIKRIVAHGKAAGILTGDLALAKRYVELGATFVAIGTDVGLLSSASSRLLADFHKTEPTQPGRPAMTAGY